MGVPGLWDILRPTGQVRSLTQLAVVDGFEANNGGHRGFRIGIDASIWFFHATYGREGENPELRTLFFRCCRLMTTPFLPLFVFDGPKRPSVKRGKRISGNQHWLTTGMKNIIEAFGFEWRTAPGEAEAELAYLNRIGVIDAILSDDVDNFLFGAIMVIRNPSNTLSGNKSHPIKNTAGKDDGNHTVVYKSQSLLTHPSVGLTQGGLILIGLLSGGDYHQAGLARCGPGTAHGLAKCGFGDALLDALDTLPRDCLPDFLEGWRQDVRNELRSNSQGHLGRKNPSLAKAVPDDFPDIDILLSYAKPITSESEGCSVKVNWTREPDLGKVAGLCELYFEWGVKEIIIKRFRTVLWPSAVLRILRRAVLDADSRETGNSLPSTPRKKNCKSPTYIGTPSSMIAKHFSSMTLTSPTRNSDDGDVQDEEESLILKIHSERRHVSTDNVLEYRLEIAPAQLVRLAEAGVKGIRPSDSATLYSDDEDAEEVDEDDGPKSRGKKPPPEPQSHLRVWMPASVVRLAEPGIVEEYEAVAEAKAQKKAKKATGRKTAKATSGTLKPMASKAQSTKRTNTGRSRKAPTSRKMISLCQSNDSDQLETFDLSDISDTSNDSDTDSAATPTKAKAKTKLLPPTKTKSISATKTVAKPGASSAPARKDINLIDHSDDSDPGTRVNPTQKKPQPSGSPGSRGTSMSQTTSRASSSNSRSRTLLDSFRTSSSSGSTLASQAISHPSSSLSSGSRRRVLQSFPSRSFPAEEEEEEESDHHTYDLAPAIKPHGRPGTVGSDSSSDSPPRKSPRKSVNSTPRSKQARLQQQRRPVSPSPRGKVKSSTTTTKSFNPVPKTLDIIDVSSDSTSDSSMPDPRMPLAPLLMAKARQKRTQGINVVSKSREGKPGTLAPRPKGYGDVIDLT